MSYLYKISNIKEWVKLTEDKTINMFFINSLVTQGLPFTNVQKAAIDEIYNSNSIREEPLGYCAKLIKGKICGF
jgi:hypothetical protein